MYLINKVLTERGTINKVMKKRHNAEGLIINKEGWYRRKKLNKYSKWTSVLQILQKEITKNHMK